MMSWEDGFMVPGTLMSQAWTGLQVGKGLRTKVPGPPPARVLEDKGAFQAGDAVEGRGQCQARDACGFSSQIAPAV